MQLLYSMSSDDDDIINEFRKALSSAGEAIRLLSELSEHENLDVAWSSQVARAQTKIADSIRTCKSRLADMSDLVEYEGRCDTNGRFLPGCRQYILTSTACFFNTAQL